MTTFRQDNTDPGINRTPSTAAAAARKVKVDAEELEGAVEEIPRPFTSYGIIANLAQAEESLAESVQELAAWHGQASDGTHFEESGGKGRAGATGAAVKLDEAAQLARELKNKLREALDENGKVRWLDDTKGQRE